MPKDEESKTINATTSIPVKQPTNLKMIPITFEEGYNANYWPALVVIGIKNGKNTGDGDWTKFVDQFMVTHNFFNKGGKLENIYTLSPKDNVNGNNGSNVVVLKFSNDTDIDTGARLYYHNNFIWPEDFFCFHNQYYTWYKSGKKLSKLQENQ